MYPRPPLAQAARCLSVVVTCLDALGVPVSAALCRQVRGAGVEPAGLSASNPCPPLDSATERVHRHAARANASFYALLLWPETTARAYITGKQSTKCAGQIRSCFSCRTGRVPNMGFGVPPLGWSVSYHAARACSFVKPSLRLSRFWQLRHLVGFGFSFRLLSVIHHGSCGPRTFPTAGSGGGG